MTDSTGQPETGGLDLGALLEQAQAMKSQVDEAQQQLAETVFVGSAAGDKVTIEVTGQHEFKSVQIKPEAVDVDDIELLEDLILAALRDASSQMSKAQEESMGEVGMPDLGGLGGMLGGSDPA